MRVEAVDDDDPRMLSGPQRELPEERRAVRRVGGDAASAGPARLAETATAITATDQRTTVLLVRSSREDST